jgi:hypothetical protein
MRMMSSLAVFLMDFDHFVLYICDICYIYGFDTCLLIELFDGLMYVLFDVHELIEIFCLMNLFVGMVL